MERKSWNLDHYALHDTRSTICDMRIGIDASRAFVKNRTGIGEYSFHVIKNLMNTLKNHRVVLYINPTNYEFITNVRITNKKDFFEIPKSWRVKVIKWPYLWTQVGLSLEILFHPVDVLFIPAHTVPFVHPKNTIVTIHGLEYEVCPQAYSFWERLYMRFAIKNSCRWARKIIAVSENTRKDLVKLYKVPGKKIKIIYEGTDSKLQITNYKLQTNSNDQVSKLKPYLLFIGRLEERKNISGIIKAFEILKEKYKIPHKLILAGRPGYGYANIMSKVSAKGGSAFGGQSSKFRKDILIKGFVSEEKKYSLFKNADVFLFPSFYEGFGLPILEAQSAGAPVVTSNASSMAEIVKLPRPLGEDARRAGEGISERIEVSPSPPTPLPKGEVDSNSALLVNPHNHEEIAEATYKLISDETLRKSMLEKGFENAKRFNWKKCAEEIADLLKG